MITDQPKGNELAQEHISSQVRRSRDSRTGQLRVDRFEAL